MGISKAVRETPEQKLVQQGVGSSPRRWIISDTEESISRF